MKKNNLELDFHFLDLGSDQIKKMMKFVPLLIPPSGSWIRDCELYAFQKDPCLSLKFHKESDDTSWDIYFEDYVAFKITCHEFAVHLICSKQMPNQGAFFYIENSPWLNELKKVDRPEILDNCKHYVLFFYDEVVEVISNDLKFKKN